MDKGVYTFRKVFGVGERKSDKINIDTEGAKTRRSVVTFFY